MSQFIGITGSHSLLNETINEPNLSYGSSIGWPCVLQVHPVETIQPGGDLFTLLPTLKQQQNNYISN